MIGETARTGRESQEDTPVHLLVLRQHQVVATQGHTEDDGRHTLETVDPFLSLTPLAADVEHPEMKSLQGEEGVMEQSELS